MVTKDLEKAFDLASKLPPREQQELAAWILEELRADRKWARSLGASQAQLARLAQEALGEYDAGESEHLDPDKL